MNNARYCRKCGCYLPDNKYICLACGLDNYKNVKQENRQPIGDLHIPYYYSTYEGFLADRKPYVHKNDCSSCIYAENVHMMCFSENESEIKRVVYCKKRLVTFIDDYELDLDTDKRCCCYYKQNKI